MIALFAGLFWAIAFIGNNQAYAAYESFCTDNIWIIDIPVAECQTLVNMYNSTNGANWYNNTNWWSTTTICDNGTNNGRFGVNCNAGHVSFLNFDNNNLSWILPSLTGIPRLAYLYLGNNKITSIANNGFDGLTWAIEFQLEYNLLTTIPSLSGLSNLTSIQFQSNHLTSLPSLSGFSNLYYIDLSYNRLTSVPSLAGLSTLQYLYLNNNSLTSLPSLAGLSTLQYLYLNNNSLTSLPSLADLSGLLTLYVHQNQLTSLPSLAGLSNLQYLLANNNKIATLPENLASVTTLLDVWLWWWLNLNTNKICTGTMSPGLITFVNSKSYYDWQAAQNTSLCNLTRTGDFSVNNHSASTTTGVVTLSITVSWTTNMRFSNTGSDWPRTSWEAYSPTKSWILTPEYWMKTVRAQFDTDSNTSTVEWATSYSIEYVGVVSRCTGAWSGSDVTLCIEPIGLGYCEYGNSLDLGITWYSAAGRDITSAFNTTSGNAAWFCNDLQGANPRTLSIQSSDLLNVSTNDPGQTISASNIYIKNPSATKIEWVCTANAGSSLNQRTSIDVSTIILGKSNSIGEVCKVQTSSLDFKVAIPAYQSLGQYSGTLTITVPNL